VDFMRTVIASGEAGQANPGEAALRFRRSGQKSVLRSCARLWLIISLHII
jgi:hypothetical protein